MRPDDARHGVRMAAAIERHARVVDVDAVERGRKAVRVALAADFAVGDDVETGRFLGADGEHRRVVLCLGEQRLRYAPQLARAYARRKTLREPRAVDEPLGLRITADEGGGEKHALTPPATARRARARRGSHAPCSSSSGAVRTDFSRWPSNWMGGRTAAAPPCAPWTGTTIPRWRTCGSSTTLSTELIGANGTSFSPRRSAQCEKRMLGEVPAELPAELLVVLDPRQPRVEAPVAHQSLRTDRGRETVPELLERRQVDGDQSLVGGSQDIGLREPRPVASRWACPRARRTRRTAPPRSESSPRASRPRRAARCPSGCARAARRARRTRRRSR